MGKERPRLTRFGRAFTPKATVDYEKHVEECALEVAQNRLYFDSDVPLRCFITAYFEPPQSASKRKRKALLNDVLFYTSKPDCDNIAKIILDSLQDRTVRIKGEKVVVPGVCFHDDSRVAGICVKKLWAESAGVKVRIEEAVL